jgi:hypothetical protein
MELIGLIFTSAFNDVFHRCHIISEGILTFSLIKREKAEKDCSFSATFFNPSKLGGRRKYEG